MPATTFRKKPVEIEAMQFGGSNGRAVAGWVLGNGQDAQLNRGEVLIMTLEGIMHVSPGDWVIRGVQGEFYPCKPDIFDATYEPVHQVTRGATVTEGERTVPLSEYLGR